MISVTGAHWVTAQDTNEDRVMPIALHCMEKHECMMHVSCVVFEDKCHFRKTMKIRPPAPGEWGPTPESVTPYSRSRVRDPAVPDVWPAVGVACADDRTFVEK